MDIDMANAQLLETFYQDSRHRAVAPGSESSTPPFITMGEHGTLGDTQDTERGVHIESVTVPTIVTVEEPSQASEGKSDSQPPLIESFFPSQNQHLWLPQGILHSQIYLKKVEGNSINLSLKQFRYLFHMKR